jgi:hypothetical protein
MFKKLLPVAIGLLLVHALVPPVYAKADTDKQLKLIERVKEGVARLGTGQDARIWVKLRDKTKRSGYVSEIGEHSFTITDLKTGAATIVAYPAVAQVKGNNISTGAKVAIGLGIAVVVLVILLIFENYG